MGMITEPVFSSVKAPVEKQEINAAQRSTGHQRAIQLFRWGSSEFGVFGGGTALSEALNYSNR
jgi:hypothetical protein